MIDRTLQDPDEEATATQLILTRKAMRFNKEGRLKSGDYPEEFLTQTPAFFNKDATLATKDNNDLLYDYMHILIQNDLIRENIPDEEYTLKHFIEEMQREYAAVNLDTMNKAGPNNNRRLVNTSISESTHKQIEGRNPQEGGKGFLGGLFKRK